MEKVTSPLLSVIVPVYNVEKYLSRCIDSILSQTFTDFELILVDDGSPDRCGEICDEYAKKDDRIIVIHQENKGVSAARNRGLCIAQGEYITFCDSDDFVYIAWLQNFIENISNVDLCVQSVEFVDCENNHIFKRLSNIEYKGIQGVRDFIISLIDIGCYGYSFTKLFKKSIIERYNLRFDIYSTFREDEQFLSSYLEHIDRVRTISSIGYCYFLPPASKSYKGNSYNSLLPILESFNLIFDKKFPNIISTLHYTNVKGAIVYSLLNNQLPNDRLIYYLQLFSSTQSFSLKNRITTFFMLHSPRLKSISIIMIKFIYKITSIQKKQKKYR